MSVDEYGQFRYLEVSHWAEGRAIVSLDQAVWELRRFCTTLRTQHHIRLIDGFPAPKVRLTGGYLEELIDGERNNEARAALLWQNGFFGRARRTVRVGGWVQSTNAPLALRPQIIDELVKYVFVPKDLRDHCRSLASQSGRRR